MAFEMQLKLSMRYVYMGANVSQLFNNVNKNQRKGCIEKLIRKVNCTECRMFYNMRIPKLEDSTSTEVRKLYKYRSGKVARWEFVERKFPMG